MEVVAAARSRVKRWHLVAALTLGHFGVTGVLLALVRSGGVGVSGEAQAPVLDVLLAAAFHALTVPMLALRLLFAPILRGDALDAGLFAFNAVLHAELWLRAGRWLRARRQR